MTQQLRDLIVESWVDSVPTVQLMRHDLISLRAAVRRLIEVDDDYKRGNWNSVKLNSAIDALRAEMAAIDTPPNAGEEQKP